MIKTDQIAQEQLIGWVYCLDLAEDPSSFDHIYVHKYFHICSYFICKDTEEHFDFTAIKTPSFLGNIFEFVSKFPLDFILRH